MNSSKWSFEVTSKIILFLALSVTINNAWSGDLSACQSVVSPAVSLDIELLGDTSVESMRKQDAFLLAKFSDEFRSRLEQQKIFTIIDDKQSLAVLNEAAQHQFLHRCNGCELAIAKKLGAKKVIVPWIFRMSKLVQTMFVELRDVETGTLVMRKKLNFRGNTDDAWDHVINRMVEEMHAYVAKCSL